MPLPLRNKIIVIGKGRFGNAIAQGLREGGFVEHDYGTRVLCEVVQVSASEFTRLAASQMAHELQGATFVAYCGTKLPKYATTLASALQLASKKSSLPEHTAIEFIDFSNPDPMLEKADVSGAIDLWVALHAIRDGYDEELVLKNEVALIKVSKVTEVGSIDASGAVGNTGRSSVSTDVRTDSLLLQQLLMHTARSSRHHYDFRWSGLQFPSWPHPAYLHSQSCSQICWPKRRFIRRGPF